MTTAAAPGPEDEIRALIDDWLTAIRAGDLDAIMAHYAPGVTAYDAVMALRFQGAAAYREHWRMCLSMCPGPMTFETDAPEIAAAGDLAFAHCLIRCGGPDDTGKVNASWMRMTAGYRRTGGRWKIVHEHFSAPFDPESGKALFELTP